MSERKQYHPEAFEMRTTCRGCGREVTIHAHAHESALHAVKVWLLVHEERCEECRKERR